MRHRDGWCISAGIAKPSEGTFDVLTRCGRSVPMSCGFRLGIGHVTCAECLATSPDWDALEHHARTLDRSEAQHILRVRAHQTARAQAHGSIKLPNDAQLRGAIEEYVAAIAIAARRRELISAAQASISEADAEVARTHERCVELGIISSQRRTTRRVGQPRPITAAGSVSQQVIDAVAAGATTPAEVAERIGGTSTRAAGALLNLATAGQVHREKDENGRWRYSPIGGEQ